MRGITQAGLAHDAVIEDEIFLFVFEGGLSARDTPIHLFDELLKDARAMVMSAMKLYLPNPFAGAGLVAPIRSSACLKSAELWLDRAITS